MFAFFNKKAKAKAEQLRQEQYRIAYEHEQNKLKQKYEPLFLTLLLLYLHGRKTIKTEQIGGDAWWDSGQIKASLSKNNKALFEIHRTEYNIDHPVQYTLTIFIPNKTTEYKDFPAAYAKQLFDFLAHLQGTQEMIQIMLYKNGNQVPKTNEYLENLLSYTMLQNGVKPARVLDGQKCSLLHNLVNINRYSR